MAAVIDSFNIGHHFKADDFHLLLQTSLTAVRQYRRRLELCAENLKDCRLSRRHHLNQETAAFIWFDSKFTNRRQLDTNLNICSVVVEPTDFVRDIGAILGSVLPMRQHVGKLSSF